MQILQFKIILHVNLVIKVLHFVINVQILLNVLYVQLIYFCQFKVMIV